MMYLAGQILAVVGGAYIGAMAVKYHNFWIVLAFAVAMVGVAMSLIALKVDA